MRKPIPTDNILETQAAWRECLLLGQLARTIVRDGHGAIILIVPSGAGPWLGSLKPFSYRLAKPDTRLRDVIRQELNSAQVSGERLQQLWKSDVPIELKNWVTDATSNRHWYNEHDIRAVGSLAGVDGAIVLSRNLEVIGFGAKLAASAQVEQVLVIRLGDHVDGNPTLLKDVGGTRHQSATEFVGQHHDCVAVVVSQDRHMSVAHWDEATQQVILLRGAEFWA
jgi:hypothetical protein